MFYNESPRLLKVCRCLVKEQRRKITSCFVDLLVKYFKVILIKDHCQTSTTRDVFESCVICENMRSVWRGPVSHQCDRLRVNEASSSHSSKSRSQMSHGLLRRAVRGLMLELVQ